MSRVDELACIVGSMPRYDREKFDECATAIIALVDRYGMIATLAMSIHVTLYQENVSKSQAVGLGYFEYLAGRG